MEKLKNPEKLSYNEIIAQGQSNLFDFKYPIFDENYRTTLQTNICKHYYTSEICCDAVQRFKLWLDVRMNTIMPYYNKLYKSELLKINPLTDYSEDENINVNNKANANQNVEQNIKNDGLRKDSNTPQAMLSNLEYYDNASDYTDNSVSNSKSDNTQNFNGTSKRNRVGYHTSPSDLLLKYRNTFLKIDLMIINDLSDLFYGILSVG